MTNTFQPRASRSVSYLMFVLASALAAGCGKDGGGITQPSLSSIVLSASSLTLSSLGESSTLVATATGSDGRPFAGAQVNWSSSNNGVAAVSTSGTVTAISNGVATVTARSGNMVASATVTVNQVAAAVTITLERSATYRGNTTTVTATARDARDNPIAGRSVDIQSSNQAIVRTVNGSLEALAEGTVTIAATLDNARAERVFQVLPVANVIGFPLDSLAVIYRSYAVSLRAILTNGDTLPAPLSAISSSDSTVIARTSTGVRALRQGVADVRISAANFSQVRRVKVRIFEDVPVSADLKTVDPAATHRIPVIDIRLIPTRDGIRLDSLASPDFYTIGGMSVDAMRQRIENILVRTKYALEEGSRFRGYASTTTPPSIALEVVRSVIYYGVPPAGPVGHTLTGYPFWLVNFDSVFSVLGIVNDINQRGVKQVWVSMSSWTGDFPSVKNPPAGFDPTTARGIAESAMSNPSGMCVSNSTLTDCQILPKANHTYLMYGINSYRGWSCSVHNHGHQFERIFGHFDRDNVFWSRYATFGRAGHTHSPPNTTAGYDYNNPTLVAADIQAWQPTGGMTSMVNAQTWNSLPYRYADEDNCGGRWLTYWFQHFPGRNNQITLNGRPLENWWDIYADFDTWRAQNRTLVTGASAFGSSERVRSTTPAPAVFRPETDYPPPRRRQ